MTTSQSAEDDPGLAGVLDQRRWALDALANLGDGVLIVDSRARLVYFNDAAVRLVGASSLSADPGTWAAEYGVYSSDERTLYYTSQDNKIRVFRPGTGPGDPDQFRAITLTAGGVP